MLRNKYFLLHIKKVNISTYQVMYYISHLVKEKKQFRPVIFKDADSKMAASIVFQTGHTFWPSMLYPVYRSVVTGIAGTGCQNLSKYLPTGFPIFTKSTESVANSL